MASLQFQIHTDKENPISTGVKTVAGGLQGPKAKSFQAHKTPRRALGSVNEASRVGLGGRIQPGPHDLKGGISVQPSPLKPQNAGMVQKDSKLKRQQTNKENFQQRRPQQDEKGGSVCALKVRQPYNPVSLCLPDIEYMPPSSPPTDDSEDVLPPWKRPSTYVHKLLSWRPPCLFSSMPDSDTEDEEERERQRVMEQLDNLPMPADHDIFPPATLALSCEVLYMDSIPLPSMDDIPLPCIDDAPLSSVDDVTLPFMDNEEHNSGVTMSPSQLDDSLGLVPHLGSLEILDTCMPSGDQDYACWYLRTEPTGTYGQEYLEEMETLGNDSAGNVRQFENRK